MWFNTGVGVNPRVNSNTSVSVYSSVKRLEPSKRQKGKPNAVFMILMMAVRVLWLPDEGNFLILFIIYHTDDRNREYIQFHFHGDQCTIRVHFTVHFSMLL